MVRFYFKAPCLLPVVIQAKTFGMCVAYNIHWQMSSTVINMQPREFRFSGWWDCSHIVHYKFCRTRAARQGTWIMSEIAKYINILVVIFVWVEPEFTWSFPWFWDIWNFVISLLIFFKPMHIFPLYYLLIRISPSILLLHNSWIIIA